MSNEDCKPSNEFIETMKQFEAKKTIVDAAIKQVASKEVASKEVASKEVANNEIDRFNNWVHNTPIKNYGFKAELSSPAIPRDWKKESW